jgi:hypothetical protein
VDRAGQRQSHSDCTQELPRKSLSTRAKEPQRLSRKKRRLASAPHVRSDQAFASASGCSKRHRFAGCAVRRERMDVPAGKRRHVYGRRQGAADGRRSSRRFHADRSICVPLRPLVFGQRHKSPRRRPGAHHPRLRRASGDHRIDGVGKPLALALHALLAGNLTFAGGIERSVANLDLASRS